MRQHSNCRLLRQNLIHRCESLLNISYPPKTLNPKSYLHMRDPINNRINLPFKLRPMFNLPLTSSNLNFPARIEEIRTGQYCIRMVRREHTHDPNQAQKGIPREWREWAKNRREIKICLSPADSMVPDLQRTSALDLTYHAVGSAYAMV
jgi:hypothetical protein